MLTPMWKPSFLQSSLHSLTEKVQLKSLWMTTSFFLRRTCYQLRNTSVESSKVPWKKQTWWWNCEVDAAVTEKRNFFKLWKSGGSRDAYVSAKRVSNRIVYHAENEALKCHLQKNKADFTNIFRLAKQIKHNNQDVVGKKPVLNDTGTLSLDDSAKKAAWREYYVCLLNHEFPWDENNLWCTAGRRSKSSYH